MKNEKCTIAVNNFPRSVWAKYTAWVHSNGGTIVNHLEYLLIKVMREAGVDIPKYLLTDLVKRVCQKTKGPTDETL
jgi:hypothetical protein